MPNTNADFDTQRARALKLCKALTQQLHALEKRRENRFANCFFVCAQAANGRSRYRDLSEICGHDPIRPIVQQQIANTAKPIVAEMFFQLGELGLELKSHATANENTEDKNMVSEALQKINTFAQCVREGEHDALFNPKLGDSWLKAFQCFAGTLECIRFHKSILSRHSQEPPFVFFGASDVERDIAPQVSDKGMTVPSATDNATLRKLFRYGWLLERLLFGARPQLHCCFLSPAGQDQRLAVCLWTGGPEPPAFELVKDVLERSIQNYWQMESELDQFAKEAESAQAVNQRWEALNDELRRELRGAEGEGVRKRLFDINAKFWGCYNIAARQKCLEEMEKQRSQKIVEGMDFGAAEQKLME